MARIFQGMNPHSNLRSTGFQLLLLLQLASAFVFFIRYYSLNESLSKELVLNLVSKDSAFCQKFLIFTSSDIIHIGLYIQFSGGTLVKKNLKS